MAALEERLERVARRVARVEGRPASFTVTCFSPDAMRRWNRRHLGRRRLTDVIAFALPQPDGTVVGDIYVCPAYVERQATRLGVPLGEELLRVGIHGALHVLGYDHPEGEDRTGSAMWERQERYVRRFGGRLQ